MIYIALSIAKGMQGIHDLGIVHRDLKTGNVLIKFHEGSLPEIVICGKISLLLFLRQVPVANYFFSSSLSPSPKISELPELLKITRS